MCNKDFTIEDKIKAIALHIRDRVVYGVISDRYGVPISTLRHWIRKYQTLGVAGLMQRKGNQLASSSIAFMLLPWTGIYL